MIEPDHAVAIDQHQRGRGADAVAEVIGLAQVSDDDELMLITQQGKILRMIAGGIRTIGRATQGVKLIDIEGDDSAVAIARLAEKEVEEGDDLVDPGAPPPEGNETG